MIKFIQTGDLHLGSSFTSSALTGKRARRRRQELLDTFQKIINYGQKERVDLILITGDLFEHEYANQELLKYITRVLGSVAPIPIFISPGNHDPVVKNSYYLSYEWPMNVHVFRQEEWERVQLKEKGVNVYGLGWERRRINEDLLSKLKIEDKEMLNLVSIHGDMLNPTNSSYLPIDKAKLELIGADYYALGHIHQREEFMIADRLKAAYSGSPEPLNINEGGKHGFYLGKLDKSGLELNFVPIAQRKYVQDIVRLNEDDTYDLVRNKLKEKIFNPNNLYRLILEGSIDSELELDLKLLNEELAGKVFHLEIIDQTTPCYDLEGLKQNYQGNAIGLFIEAMEKNIDSATGKEREELKRALYYGLDALLGKKVILR